MKFIRDAATAGLRLAHPIDRRSKVPRSNSAPSSLGQQTPTGRPQGGAWAEGGMHMPREGDGPGPSRGLSLRNGQRNAVKSNIRRDQQRQSHALIPRATETRNRKTKNITAWISWRRMNVPRVRQLQPLSWCNCGYPDSSQVTNSSAQTSRAVALLGQGVTGGAILSPVGEKAPSRTAPKSSRKLYARPNGRWRVAKGGSGIGSRWIDQTTVID